MHNRERVSRSRQLRTRSAQDVARSQPKGLTKADARQILLQWHVVGDPQKVCALGLLLPVARRVAILLPAMDCLTMHLQNVKAGAVIRSKRSLLAPAASGLVCACTAR
eukprot:6203589-Pleurochrysis_carterae.AAC.3